MTKRGKFTVIGISGILVVGVVIGCVVGVQNTNKPKGADNKNDVLSTASKAVATICATTDYKEACVNSLSSVANNQSATPQQLVQATFQYTIDEVKHVLSNTSSFKNEAKDPLNKMAADDCQELLQYAVDELQAAFSFVGDSSLHTPEDREAEINNWLSAVLSYQETCIDGFNSTELSKAMSDKLMNARQLSDNALAISTAFNDIMKAFNIPITIPKVPNVKDIPNAPNLTDIPNVPNVKDIPHVPNVTDFPKVPNATDIKNVMNPNSRRLLDTEGYPTWMSGADRKLLQSNNRARPNAVVAKDGSGQFKSIGAALAAYPKNNRGRYVIYIKAGVYDEYITVEKNQVNVLMYGDGPRKTIVTGKKSYATGFTTMRTASFSAIGDGFMAKGMTFKNTAGAAGHQAVALRVQSDMAVFYNCKMDGYQDTLYLHQHRHFIRNCVISGTVDFIFGMGTTVIQNSNIIVRLPMKGQQNTVTAHGRQTARENTGLVIQNCRILPERRLAPVRFEVKSFLGRPWKEYSRTVIMESELADFIQPAGWMPWAGNFALNTLYYAEYGNRGPGANTARRVNWRGFHVLRNKNEVIPFTAGRFLQGASWIPKAGVPHYLGTSR